MEMLSVSAHRLEIVAEPDSDLQLPSWYIDFSAVDWYSNPDRQEQVERGQAGLTGELPSVTRYAKNGAIYLPGLRLGVVNLAARRGKSPACAGPSDTVVSPTRNEDSIPILSNHQVNISSDEMTLFT